jgi:hypothetical protein
LTDEIFTICGATQHGSVFKKTVLGVLPAIRTRGLVEAGGPVSRRKIQLRPKPIRAKQLPCRQTFIILAQIYSRNVGQYSEIRLSTVANSQHGVTGADALFVA